MKDIPKSALETARYYAPGVVFHRYAYEDEDGIRIYEFEAFDHEGKHIEVDVLANGELQEIEWETDIRDVPVYVRMELQRKFPKVAVTFIELSIRPNGTTHYEFEGLDKNGNFVDIEIIDDGRAITTTML